MRQTKAQRLEKQRIRSKENRQRRRSGRIPDRDDIARVALRWLLISAASYGDDRKLFKLEGHILDGLARQGFDPRASEDVLEDLIEKYAKDHWDFFPKLHLRPMPSSLDSVQNEPIPPVTQSRGVCV